MDCDKNGVTEGIRCECIAACDHESQQWLYYSHKLILLLRFSCLVARNRFMACWYTYTHIHLSNVCICMSFLMRASRKWEIYRVVLWFCSFECLLFVWVDFIACCRWDEALYEFEIQNFRATHKSNSFCSVPASDVRTQICMCVRTNETHHAIVYRSEIVLVGNAPHCNISLKFKSWKKHFSFSGIKNNAINLQCFSLF